MLNLVLNAVDAMPNGGRLRLCGSEVDDAVEITIADSGAGISVTALDHLCEPFFTTKSHGTGLGLAIVDRITEAHGGDLRVGNCPDGGAEFTLRLPLAPAHNLENAA